MTSFWFMRPPRRPPGDNSGLLLHGMATRRQRVDGRIQLERVGPEIAPLTMPHDLIVTAAFRLQLEAEGFAGLSFVPVDKVHIVRLDVKTDLMNGTPDAPTPSGEPEDILLSRAHDQQAANAMRNLWELVPARGGLGRVNRVRNGSESIYDVRLDVEDGFALDVFMPTNSRRVFASERFRRFILAQPGVGLDFFPASLGPLGEEPPPDRHYLHSREPVPAGDFVTEERLSPFTGEPMRIATRKP